MAPEHLAKGGATIKKKWKEVRNEKIASRTRSFVSREDTHLTRAGGIIAAIASQGESKRKDWGRENDVEGRRKRRQGGLSSFPCHPQRHRDRDKMKWQRGVRGHFITNNHQWGGTEKRSTCHKERLTSYQGGKGGVRSREKK